ncbi:methyltransferase-like protein 22 isoform X2 [Crassostrea angulata]|uniref:methyltransferase-like protein 22 isoform X2 n=1 Tax=Magallana angulata TaxID=2784310 RepID=UPI0022B16E47|nr:methyltransferase-like protein 22 isoform X2 [Crassostrea angulata]
MEPTEKVLSDVHLTSQNTAVEGNTYTVSRLWFTLPPSKSINVDETEEINGTGADEDGDLMLRRKTSKCKETGDRSVLTIAHWMETELKDVGKQLWHGSLLLADYLIHVQEELRNETVVELGAGTGLASIVASFFAKNVVCTDTGEDVLKLADHNLDQNWNCLDPIKEKNFKVCQLDWVTESPTSGTDKYTIKEEEVSLINTARIFIAGDVVYDDKLTIGFFNTVYKLLMNFPAKSLFISLEKRYIFTLEDKDVVAPAFDYFCECLEALMETTSNNGVEFHYKEIPVDFPQYFTYNRTKELILYKIYTTFPNTST